MVPEGGWRERLSDIAIGFIVLASSLAVSLANLTGSLKILDIGGKPHDVSLAVMSYNMLYTAMSLYWTRIFYPLLDRRDTIILSLTGMALGLGIMYRTSSVTWLIASSGIIGMFSAVLSPLLTTILTEHVGKDSVAVTKYYIYSSLGMIIGYLMGGVIRGYAGIGIVLLVAMMASLLAVPFSFIFTPKYIVVEPRKSLYLSGIPHFTGRLRPLPSTILSPRILYNMQRLIKDFRAMLHRRMSRRLPLILAGTFLFFTGVSAFFSLVPPMLKHLGVYDRELYLLYLYSTLVTIVSYVLFLKTQRAFVNPWRPFIATILSRTIIFSLPVPLLLLGGSHWTVIWFFVLFFTLIGVTWAFITVYLPVLVLSVSEPERRDERLGHMNASIGGGMIIGSALSGIIVNVAGFEGVAIYASLSSMLSALVYIKAERAIVS